MIGMLLNACPSFAPQWQAFLAEWRNERDDLPLYLVLADFARHLIGMLERNETDETPIPPHNSQLRWVGAAKSA